MILEIPNNRGQNFGLLCEQTSPFTVGRALEDGSHSGITIYLLNYEYTKILV